MRENIFNFHTLKAKSAYLYYLVCHHSRPNTQTDSTKNQHQSPCHYKSKCNFGFINSHDY